MDRSVSRRTILKAGVGTSAAWAFTATSYAKIVGANERIALGLIGCGGRGYEAHMTGDPPTTRRRTSSSPR